jgi:chromosome segregation ATPase
MPDGAKDLYSFREMDEATREQIRASVLSQPTEAETHEAATEEPETVSAETADGSGDGSSAPATPTSSEGGEGVSPSAAADWEARFKGASRKINELQESIRSKDSKIQDLESQLVALTKDLAASSDKVSALSATLEDGVKALEAKDRELAEARDSLAKVNEHARHLEETRNLLTGGVLCVSESDSEYEAKMAKAKSAKEREHLRALKRAGKIN